MIFLLVLWKTKKKDSYQGIYNRVYIIACCILFVLRFIRIYNFICNRLLVFIASVSFYIICIINPMKKKTAYDRIMSYTENFHELKITTYYKGLCTISKNNTEHFIQFALQIPAKIGNSHSIRNYVYFQFKNKSAYGVVFIQKLFQIKKKVFTKTYFCWHIKLLG